MAAAVEAAFAEAALVAGVFVADGLAETALGASLPPPVHVRDQLDLRPNNYRIGLKGVTVGTGEAYPGMWLAIDPGHAREPVAAGNRFPGQTCGAHP